MAAVVHDELIQVDALGPGGPYRARTRQTITDVTGESVAELSLVPALYVDRTIAGLRAAAPLAPAARKAALSRAGELFLEAEIDGLTLDAYQQLVSRVSGLALTVIRTSSERIATACERAFDQVTSAMPAGSVFSWDDARAESGSGLWVRKGEVFAVLAAGNHPAVHANWVEALALGYRVAVRPSRREPFTPARLIAALRMAGFGDDRVALLPTDHAAADDLVRAADRSMVYGGDDVIRKYGADSSVLPQGPGRSKILVTAEADWHRQLDMIVDSVSRNGGVSCTNTTAVFVERDADLFAAALADRLSRLPSRVPVAGDAILPVQPVEAARALGSHLERVAEGTRAMLGGEGIVDELGDGSAAIRPAVHLLADANGVQAGVELPFPCVWVAPWAPSDGVAPFRDTLAMTALTSDPSLIERLLSEPGIRNLYTGAHPTTWSAPGVPHDGYLADFLMESKGIIRDSRPARRDTT